MKEFEDTIVARVETWDSKVITKEAFLEDPLAYLNYLEVNTFNLKDRIWLLQPEIFKHHTEINQLKKELIDMHRWTRDVSGDSKDRIKKNESDISTLQVFTAIFCGMNLFTWIYVWFYL